MVRNIIILYCKFKSFLNKDITIFAVDMANKNIITFKNGSVIEILPLNNEPIRGNGSKILWYSNSDYNYREEGLKEILKDLI